MSSIGDKKVALNLSDGTSVNLNKPKVLPDTITKFADITEIGWYEGKITPSGKFPNRTCQISDCPDTLPLLSHPYGFTLFVFDSRFNKDDGMSYVYFGYDSVYVGNGFLDDNADFFIKWRLLSSKEEVLKDLVVDDLTSTSTDKALSAKQGKELKSLIDGLGIKTIDSSITDLASITESGTYIGATNFDKTDADDDGKMYYTSSLKNWPGLIINVSGAVDGAPYILRVTNVKINTMYEPVTCTYYELLCLNYYELPIGKQKAHGINRMGHIDWINDNTRIEDSLASHSTESALSANQGRVLNDKISQLTNTDTVGSASNPVYMKNGTITAGTYTFSASTIDLTAGTSTLATNEIRFIYG